VNPDATLLLAMLAAYGLASLALTALVVVAWRAGLERLDLSADELLALRLVPCAGALLLVATVMLPAFLAHEPPQQVETIGVLGAALAALAVGFMLAAARRGWRASATARRLLQGAAQLAERIECDGRHVDVLAIRHPIVAAVGTLRPRIVAAESVRAACSSAEFRQVVAHEAAHIAARDNLKLLCLLASPDVLTWLPLGRSLATRWRTAAEYGADARSTGTDRHKRLALASALVKVARLTGEPMAPRVDLSLAVAADEVAGRVRRLLAPAEDAPRRRHLKLLVPGLLVVPVAALPLYESIHGLLEALIAVGR
jgi:beta-lactamase regulating signal transducer with metallopeptidase domain